MYCSDEGAGGGGLCQPLWHVRVAVPSGGAAALLAELLAGVVLAGTVVEGLGPVVLG